MKLVRWKRFTWELSQLPPLDKKLPSHYVFRPAAREDAKIVKNVIMTALSLDSAWTDTLKIFRDPLEAQLDQVFVREAVPAIVITHGPRIIAASALTADAAADFHLISGPCVLSEYCNRGLGTALLHATLEQLRTMGLERALAVTKESTTPCKFVYPKFGSTNAAFDYSQHLLVS